MDPYDTVEALDKAKGLKLVHLNVRSLPKKMEQIRLMLSGANLDVITFSETWLKSYLHTQLVDLEGYKTFRLDRGANGRRSKRGGGLITYIHEKHASDSESLDDLNVSNEHIEAQWTFIHRPFCKNIFVCNVYRPPSGDLNKAISHLDDCLKTINLGKNNLFLLGDMNVNYINKKSLNFKKLNFFIQSNGLTQYINTTTRNTDKSNSLIDIALTNSKFICAAGTLDHFISDHQPIYLVHKKAKDNRPTAQFKGRSYRNFDSDKFRDELAKADWDTFYASSDPVQVWNTMQNFIVSTLDQMCPIRTFHIKNYRPDWMTKDLIEQIKDRDYFYKQAKKTGDVDMWNIAKHLRNVTNSHIRSAKREFVLNELKLNENNAKKFWKVIRSVIPSNKSCSNSEILLRDGDIKIDKAEVAHFINDYFVNIGNLPPQLDKRSIGEGNSPMEVGPDESMGYAWSGVGELEVYKAVKSINTSKSSGLDNISSMVIKLAFESLIPEVTYMYNLSLEKACFPDNWKKALVVPIPKQGNLTKVQNYRPISLLPLPGKVLEKLVHSQLSEHLETDSLLSDNQFGFRKSRSTVHAIAQVTDFINKKMDAHLATIALFIDFKKAFDCVQHPVLIRKLKDLGFSDTIITWVTSYLSHRKQRVYANGTYSEYLDITQGVPQGSVLGPLFYIVYANDLVNIVKHCKLAMYADDTVLYISRKNFDVSVKNLQEDINSIALWCQTNGITANTDKTKVMVFGSKCTLVKLPNFEVKFGDAPLQAVSSYKYLGLTLGSQLNYNLHVSKIIGSVTGKLKQFQRMRSFLNNKAALMVYKGMILPILEYGDVFLHAASVENRKKMQTLQNKGLRCALNRGIDTGTVELHKEANLLKLHYRREQHILNYIFDNAQVESNLKVKSGLTVQTRSSTKLLLKVKRPSTEKFKRSLAYVGPSKWNALPERFHRAHSKATYKILVEGWVNAKAAVAANVFHCTS